MVNTSSYWLFDYFITYLYLNILNIGILHSYELHKDMLELISCTILGKGERHSLGILDKTLKINTSYCCVVLQNSFLGDITLMSTHSV